MCTMNIVLRFDWFTHLTGGSSGGVAGVATPALNFPKKIAFIRVAVVIDLVVTSSNNACLYALNGVAVCRMPQSTDLYNLFQSTDKNELRTNLRIFSYSVRLLPPPPDPIALSRYSTGKQDLLTNLRFFSFSVRLLPLPPPPPPTRDSRYFARAE